MKRSTSIRVVFFVLIFSVIGIFVLKYKAYYSVSDKEIYIENGKELAEVIIDYLEIDREVYPVEIEDRGVKDIDIVLKSNIYSSEVDVLCKNGSKGYLIFLEKAKEEGYRFKVILTDDYLKGENKFILSGKIDDYGKISDFK